MPEPGDRYKRYNPSIPLLFEGVPASQRPTLGTFSGAKWRVGEILPMAANQCHSQKIRKAVSLS